MAGPKDSGKLNVNLNTFVGGESIDFKNGIASSFLSSEAMDFRSKASQMTVLPGASMLASSSALLDLPVDMVQDPTGVRWMIGDQGNLYKLAVDNTITKVATMSSASGHGLVYNPLSDMLYITGQQTVSMYGPVSTTGIPAQFYSDQFAQSASTANGVVNLYDAATGTWSGSARNNLQSIALTQGVTATSQVTTNATTNYYTTPNAVSEADADRCPFSPDLEPFYSVAVYLKQKGTGNLVLTLHDGMNQQLAQVVIANASLVVGYNEFVFPAPGIRSFTGAIQSGLSAAYHFHVTSTVAADSNMRVATITSSQLNTADFILFNYRLARTNNGWHPATIFTGNGFMLCVGNGQYLTTYNFSNDQKPSNNVWQRMRFPIDAGFEVCGLSVNNQYLVIAAEKRSTSSTRNYQEGALYFWDGQTASYNFKIQVPMGAPYSINTINNITYFICAGYLYAWGGGQQIIKVRPIAYQNTDYLGTVDNTVVNPNMLATRYNMLMIGYPSSTTNPTVKYGVYSWGAAEMIYPNSFGYSYALSNGQYYKTAGNNLQIGMIKNFVDTLYIASKYTSGATTYYRLDVVNNESEPAANFNWSSLIYDGGVRYKQKLMCRYKINFLPWPEDATLTAWYSIDRGAQTTGQQPNPGDTSIVIDVPNGRFFEGQWGFYGTCANPESVPTITGIDMEIDPLQTESDLRHENQGG